MLAAVLKALSQMLSPPFRMVLLKSVALALALVVLLGIGLHRLLVLLEGTAQTWGEAVLGGSAHAPIVLLGWLFSIAAGLIIVVGAIFLMPAATAVVASFFADEIALRVERTYYPDERVGVPLPLMRAVWEGAKIASLTLVVYLVAIPFLLLAGTGVIV